MIAPTNSSSYSVTEYCIKLTHYGKREVADCVSMIPPGGRFDEPLILTEVEWDTLEKSVTEHEEKMGQKSPRAPGWDPLKQIGATMPRPAASNLKPYWKGYPWDPAQRCGFDDRYQFERMSLYLAHNSQRQLMTVSPSA